MRYGFIDVAAGVCVFFRNIDKCISNLSPRREIVWHLVVK